MKDLQLVYDALEFYRDHKYEFMDYNGELNGYTASKIILWSFPGSGVISGKIDKLDITQDGATAHRIFCTYKDSSDKLWGYYSYISDDWKKEFSNRTSNWIYLSDPTNENIPAELTAQPTLIPAAPADSRKPGTDNNLHVFLLWIAIVILLASSTVNLIRRNWRKNKKS